MRQATAVLLAATVAATLGAPLTALPAHAQESVQACPGNPDAIGTSRVIAIDPDKQGALLWKADLAEGTPTAAGQIMWGGAADDRHIYYSLQTGGVAGLKIFPKAARAQFSRLARATQV